MIALDTALTPPSVADITFATDNTQAGRLDGQYAAAALGGKPAVVAMLDLFNNQVVSVDIDRDHGFLEGMGINPGNANLNGQEAKTGTYKGGGKYTIACHQPTTGAIDGGRTAMENCLSANPNINVVYAINEPAAEGAYAALKAAGKQSQVMLFAIDGSCSGLKLVPAASSPRTRRSTRARWPRWASTRSPSWPAAAPSRASPPASRSSTPVPRWWPRRPSPASRSSRRPRPRRPAGAASP